MKRLLSFIAALALVLAFISTPANATGGKGIECVPKDAWTETIEHPAVTKEVHHEAVTKTVHVPAVTETTPAVWANWAPSNTQGPQDYVPIWPTDPRGKWIIHNQLPPGHDGPDGVYQQGGGNSPWFYRQAEKTVVVKEAYDKVIVIKEAWTETVVVKEAWTEIIKHDAVVCDKPEEPVDPETPVDPEVPVEPETPVDPEVPVDPEAPDTPEVPSETPDKPEGDKPSKDAGDDTPKVTVRMTPGPRRSVQCVGDAMVIKVYDTEGNSSTSTVNGHRDCTPAAGVVVNEEGM